MGLTLVLEVHNTINIAYVNILSILIFVCISLDHYFYDMCPCCTHLVTR